MSAPRLRFGPDDRIVIRGIPRRWIETVGDRHVCEALGQPGSRETFSDSDLAHESTRQDWSYERGSQSLENIRAVALSGVASIGEIPEGNERNEVLWRLAWCERFLEAEKKGEATRSRKGMEQAIQTIGPEMVKLELEKLARTATGRPRRGGTPFEVRANISARTLLRWVLAYEEHGGRAIALRPAYRRCGDKTARFCPDVETLLKKHVNAYLDEARPSKAACHLGLQADINGANIGRAAEGLPLLPTPSLKTVSERVDALNAFEVHAARYGLEAAQRRFAVLGMGLDVTRAGQRIEMDEWELHLHSLLVELDLWLTMTKAQRDAIERIRIWVCVALDAASRCVLGISFSLTPRAENALAALHMVMRDKSGIADAVEATTPFDMTCWPESVATDAGSSFVANAFSSAVLSILSSPHVMIAGKPWLRARMERFFSTAHKQAIARFPGRTFSNSVEKGDYKSEKRAATTVSMVCDALLRWIIDAYHNTPHKGLGGETPRNAWHRLVREYGIYAPPGPNVLRHVFGLDLERVSGRHGIRVLNLNYQCDALQAWRRQHGDTMLAVKLDRMDLGRISVRLGEEWHTCHCMRRGFDGVSVAAWLAATEDLRRRFAAEAEVSEAALLAAVRDAMAQAALAVERFDLGSTRPDGAQVEKAERDLLVGFRMPSTGAQPPLLSGAIDGTGPIVEHEGKKAKSRRRRARVDPTPPQAPPEDEPTDDDDVAEPDEPRIDYD